jgi:predicted O-linked N-acetylglucosamine transferase (SPINDLY family)
MRDTYEGVRTVAGGQSGDANVAGAETVSLDAPTASLAVPATKRWKFVRTELLAAARESVPLAARWWHFRGLIHEAFGQVRTAADCYERGLKSGPDARCIAFRLAQTLFRTNRLPEALRLLSRRLASFDRPRERALLALVLCDMWMLDEAERQARRAHEMAANDAFATQALVRVLARGLRYADAVKIIEAYLSAGRADRTLASWLVYYTTLQPGADEAAHQRLAALVSPSIELPVPRAPAVLQSRRGDRIRVGYVSADLRRHPVGESFEAVLRHHDLRRFDVHVFDSTARTDPTSERLRSYGHHWARIVAESGRAVARQVRKAGIDILVDLSGHTSGERLDVFARRPATRQVTWLGFPNTTAMVCMDWRVVDAFTAPDGAAFPGSERPLRLPRIFAPYTPRAALPGQDDPGAGRAPTFGSIHKFEKFNDALLDCWAELLRDEPASRLVFARDQFDAMAVRWIKAAFARRDVDPARIDVRILPAGGGGLHELFHEIDLLLDVFPWSGHIAACDALAVGVPVVTLAGRFHAGRMVGSVLAAADLRGWIATTPEEYRKLAVGIVRDRTALRAARARRAEAFRASTACDGLSFTRDLERSFEWLMGTT